LTVESQDWVALIQTAAALRARGLTWEKTAEAVGRAVATVRHWPSEHPRAWREAFDAATHEIVSQYGAEALERQQALAQTAEGDAVKVTANKAITDLWAKLWPQRQEHTGAGGGPQTFTIQWQQPPAKEEGKPNV
jgi:hypothetical protein